MKWWRDTLARRLFILMWVALVGSHLLAWSVITSLHDSPGPNGMKGGPTPVFPSLPPTPGLSDHPGPPPDMRDGPPHEPRFMPHPETSYTALLMLDYGLRLIVIAGAAWWGSRWLARPMRGLVNAGEQLASNLGSGETKTPRLNENEGTLEVREAAQVFNRMAREIEQHFEERGLMLAALSHDLRTPLTRLRLRLEAADMPEALRDKAAADITAMNGLIDEVLSLFRGVDAEPLRDVDVTALVQAMADDWVEQGQQLQCQAEGLLVARTRSAALRRVIENLVGNALRYARDAEITVASEANAIIVRVLDRGPGLAPEQLEQVFQPFYRGEASRNRESGGTGLGLFIARDLCRRMGASLQLANRDGGGLIAELRLPRN